MLINDGDKSIAKQAEAGLVRAAGRIVGIRVIEGRASGIDRDLSETGSNITAEARLAFERDLLRAIAGINTHHRRGVLLAALIALGEPRLGQADDENRPLVAWLDNKDDREPRTSSTNSSTDTRSGPLSWCLSPSVWSAR